MLKTDLYFWNIRLQIWTYYTFSAQTFFSFILCGIHLYTDLVNERGDFRLIPLIYPWFNE